jgi:hypothetical protein
VISGVLNQKKYKNILLLQYCKHLKNFKPAATLIYAIDLSMHGNKILIHLVTSPAYGCDAAKSSAGILEQSTGARIRVGNRSRVVVLRPYLKTF